MFFGVVLLFINYAYYGVLLVLCTKYSLLYIHMILKILKHYCEKLYGFMQRLEESSNVIIKPLQGQGQ